MTTSCLFRVVSDANVLVPGATVAIGSTGLTVNAAPVGSITYTTVPTNAGEYLLTTGAAPGTAISVAVIDLGTGDYILLAPAGYYIPLTVSKSGVAITAANALIGINTGDLLGATVDGSLTVQDVLALIASGQVGKVTNSWNSGTDTLTTTYYRQDGTTVAWTNATVYTAIANPPVVQSRTGSAGTLP